MLPMTTEYKNAMKKQFRDRSYMVITIGIINQEAQKDATVAEEYGAEYLYLSNLELLFDDYDVESKYATMEENWWKADGSMLFPPREDSTGFYLWNQGVISKDILGSICLVFGNVYDIRGLTIDFGTNFPLDFTITNGIKTVTVTDNKESLFQTEEIFEQTEYLLITPLSMSRETEGLLLTNDEYEILTTGYEEDDEPLYFYEAGLQDRLRIQKIYMGVGITFENKKILKAVKDEYVSPISEQLPTMDFQCTIENYGRVWDVENKDSAINYLEVGQEVSAYYGLEMEDGTITWMQGSTTVLSDWEADDSTMSFTSKDKLDSLTDIYYRGLYRPSGITLYDLAVDVFTDAGLDDRYYELDEYLKDYVVYNPLPAVSHKQCLQIIANAGRCKLYTDRDGTIVIEANIATVTESSRMSIETDTAASWSNPESVIDESLQYDYATFSKDYWTADGQMYFLDSSSDYHFVTGFVSDATSNDEGYFTDYEKPLDTADGYDILTTDGDTILFTQPVPAENPNFTIHLEAAMTYFGLTIRFMANPPQKIIIRTYYETFLVQTYEWDGPFDLENVLSQEFYKFDTMNFEFIQAQPNSRVYVSRVVFNEVTDYTFDYNVMTKSPKGKQQEKVSTINVIRTLYDYTDEVKTIFQQTIDLSDYAEYTFYFSSASYDVSVTMDSTTNLTILDSSSWFVTVNVSGYMGEHLLTVIGKAYVITEHITTQSVNSTGTIEEWTNPLISDDEFASLEARWLGNYFKNNIEYEISYRGEPRLDATDICYLENKYVAGLQIELYEHSITFGGALTGTVRARRAIREDETLSAGLMTAPNNYYILTEDGQRILTV